MRSMRILQTVILMMIVAMAASCAASKEYASKIFPSKTPVTKDTQALALRFLDLDQLDGDPANWVTTDIIKGRDSTSATYQLDVLAKTLPAAPDTTLLPKTESKPVITAPVAKQLPGEVRTKRVRGEQNNQ